MTFDDGTHDFPSAIEPGLSSGKPDVPVLPPKGLARVFYNPGLGIAFAIVFIFSILFLVYIYTFMGHFMVINIPPPEPVPQWAIDLAQQSGMKFPTPTPSPDHLMMTDIVGQNGRLVTYFIVIAGTIFVCWPIIALGIHLLARLAGGKGSFVEMAAAIGYTYVPKVLGMILIVLIVAMLPVYKVDMANYHDRSDLLRYLDPSSIYLLMFTSISQVCLILSCCLGVVAVRQVEKVNWMTATLIVGIPLVLYLLL